MSKGQTRMDTLRQTIEVMKDVTEGIRMSGFAGMILSISNPADVIELASPAGPLHQYHTGFRPAPAGDLRSSGY